MYTDIVDTVPQVASHHSQDNISQLFVSLLQARNMHDTSDTSDTRCSSSSSSSSSNVSKQHHHRPEYITVSNIEALHSHQYHTNTNSNTNVDNSVCVMPYTITEEELVNIYNKCHSILYNFHSETVPSVPVSVPVNPPVPSVPQNK